MSRSRLSLSLSAYHICLYPFHSHSVCPHSLSHSLTLKRLTGVPRDSLFGKKKGRACACGLRLCTCTCTCTRTCTRIYILVFRTSQIQYHKNKNKNILESNEIY